MTVYIIWAILAILIIWFVLAYNGFVRLKNQSAEAWADIDVQLKRRYDLIPNLINTVKGYAAHEKETLDQVVAARNQAMQAKSVKEHGNAENVLSGALKTIFALSESYPDLKANQNFLELQRELSDTENKIQAARRFYNTNVRDLNIKIDSFPSNIVASIFRFAKREFFELVEESPARQPVNVSFSSHA